MNAAATKMMAEAMEARLSGRPTDAADLYTVASDAYEEASGWHLDTHAALARYWARECSTHPLRRDVCPRTGYAGVGPVKEAA